MSREGVACHGERAGHSEHRGAQHLGIHRAQRRSIQDTHGPGIHHARGPAVQEAQHLAVQEARNTSAISLCQIPASR